MSRRTTDKGRARSEAVSLAAGLLREAARPGLLPYDAYTTAMDGLDKLEKVPGLSWEVTRFRDNIRAAHPYYRVDPDVFRSYCRNAAFEISTDPSRLDKESPDAGLPDEQA